MTEVQRSTNILVPSPTQLRGFWGSVVSSLNVTSAGAPVGFWTELTSETYVCRASDFKKNFEKHRKQQ